MKKPPRPEKQNHAHGRRCGAPDGICTTGSRASGSGSQEISWHRHVYRELAQLICGRRLWPGSRLPSSCSLAEELGVSRNTVLLALEQLMSEGYLETRRGHGTDVAVELPDAALRFRVDVSYREKTRLPLISPRAHSPVAPTHLPVTTSGLLRARANPTARSFPSNFGLAVVGELAAAVAVLPFAEDPTGYPPLRTAIGGLSGCNTRSHLAAQKISSLFPASGRLLTVAAPAVRSR